MIDSQYGVENYDKGEVKSGGCVSKYCDDTYLIVHAFNNNLQQL